jgi:hypothetical protein
VKPSDNRCGGRYHHFQEQKSTHESFEVQGHVVFFEIRGMVIEELVPSGQTVNQHHDIEVLTKLREGVGRK